MDLRSPSNAKEKEGKMSARRLAATMWEINGLKSPSGGGGDLEENESFRGEEDRKSVAKSGELFDAELGHSHLLNQSCSPAYKVRSSVFFTTVWSLNSPGMCFMTLLIFFNLFVMNCVEQGWI